MSLYTADKKIRLTLRLNDEQFGFVKGNADMLGVSPSEFLRMVINSTMSLSERRKAGLGRANEEPDINDII